MKRYKSPEATEPVHRNHEYEIAESLKYASYIQQAIFPSDQAIERVFPEVLEIARGTVSPEH
jgi:hypothetical protein